MSDVFISYSRKDKDFVQVLHNALIASKREIWIDWDSIEKGTKWWQEIEKGIEEANTFVFVISPDSVASKVCGDEINHAIRNGKRFLPIVRRDAFNQLEDINPSHQVLKEHNWLFFREEDNFDLAFGELVRSLETDIEYVRQHTEALREALKWESNQRNDSFLWQGDELAKAEEWLTEAEQRLQAVEAAENLSQRKNPNPLLTEQQRNFIHKSRENEDAKAKANLILREAKEKADRRMKISVGLLMLSVLGAFMAGVYAYNQSEFAKQKITEADTATETAKEKTRVADKANQDLVTKSQQLADVDKKRIAVEAKAKQATSKLQQADKNLKLAEVNLKTAQQQQQQARQDAENALQDKNIAQANLVQANQAVQSAKDKKAEAEAGLVTARREKQQVEQQKAETELQRKATAIEVKAIQSEALVSQNRPFDALLLAIKTVDEMQQLETKSFDAKTKRGTEWETKFALQEALFNVRERNRLTGHQDSVRSVAITPDGKTLVSGSHDNTIKVWNLEKGGEPKTLTGHQSYVNSVAITPDGKTLVSGSGDNTIKVWNLEKGGEPKTLTGHQKSVESVAITPDGKTLVSGSWDNTIKVWDLNRDSLMVKGCAWLRLYLTTHQQEETEVFDICQRYGSYSKLANP